MPKMDSPAMAIILEKLSKKPAPKMEMEVESEDDEMEDEEGMDEGEICCEEMMSAVENKDPKAFKEALMAFLDCCR